MAYGNYPDLSLVKRILVVKMRHHGDVLLTSPVFTLLKKAIPTATVDAFIYEETLPMLEGHPAIDQFILYKRAWKGKWTKELALWYQIRKRRYDLVINLTEGDRGALVALISGSRVRVGFDAQKKGFFGKNKIYTHPVKRCPHPRHTVERQLDALRRIGIFPKEDEKALFLHVPPSHRPTSLEYVLIHAVSRWRFKCLSAEQIGRLIRKLHEEGETVVMSASPDPEEIAMVEEAIQYAPDVPVINWAGKTSMKEFAALVKGAKTLITVDSVSLHIASALKTPVVAIFGPTSEVNWGPWQHPQARVVTGKQSCRPCYQDGCGGSKKSDCLLSLSTEAIIQAFYNLKLCPKYEERASSLCSSSSTVPAMSTFPS